MQIRLSWRGGVGDGRRPKRKKGSLFASSFFSDLRRVRLFDLKILLFLHKGVEKRSLSTMQGMRKMKKFPSPKVDPARNRVAFFSLPRKRAGTRKLGFNGFAEKQWGNEKFMGITALPASPALAAAGAKEEKIFAPATFFASFFYDAGFAEETRK